MQIRMFIGREGQVISKQHVFFSINTSERTLRPISHAVNKVVQANGKQ